MRVFVLMFFLFIYFPSLSAAEGPSEKISPEVAVFLVKGQFKKALEVCHDEKLKKDVFQLFKMNYLVAESYQSQIGKEISIQIRGKQEKGTLSKIKGTTLYVKIHKGAIIATWPVKVKSLPIDFRMDRIALSDSMKNLYFGVQAFRQKNYPAAKYYLSKTGVISKPILAAADKESKYILSLSQACAKGDLKQAKTLLKKGADVNGIIIAYIRNKKTKKLERLESSILIETIKNLQKELIKYLILKGADVNKSNSKGVTPLMFAIMYFPQDMTIIEYLINHQADIEVKDKSGNTPLTGAIGARRNKALKVLLKHGADINAPNKKGYTPIMLAVASNNAEIFKLLMKKGANLMKKHPRGWSIFQLDRSRMHPEIRAALNKISPIKKITSPSSPIMNRGINVSPLRR